MNLLHLLTPRRPGVALSNTDKGAAAVEFALLLPLLMILVVGILGFGQAYFTKIDLSNAAQEGARYAVVSPIVPSPPTDSQVRDVTVNASSLAPPLTAAGVTVTGSCTSAGTNVTVQATRVVNVAGAFSRTVTGRAVMRCPG